MGSADAGIAKSSHGVASRLRRAGSWSWHYVRRAPGTFIWLALLLVNSIILRHLDPTFAHSFLEKRSTNISELSSDPVRVLVASALWIAGGGWFFYFVIYQIFHVPAERWLGTLRWLLVAAIAHVGATFISEGALLWGINHGLAPESSRYTLDYGVSYALAGVVAVLTYHITKPWRYVYLVGVLINYTIPLIEKRDFTSLGHFTSVLIGLACYPLTRGRPGPWDPVAWGRTVAGRVRHHR